MSLATEPPDNMDRNAPSGAKPPRVSVISTSFGPEMAGNPGADWHGACNR